MTRNFAGNIGTGNTQIVGADPLLSDRESAAVLGCGRSTIWRWASEGVIPKPIKIGGLSRWKYSWLENVISEAQTENEAA